MADTSWKQPILTSNGTWEVDDFAVRGMGDSTYVAFDGTTNYLDGTNTGSYIEIWIKDGLALGVVVLTSSDGYLPTRGTISYSDDGKNYIDCCTWSDASGGSNTVVVSNDHNKHKYFKLTSNSRCDGKGGNADISDVTLVDYATSSSTTTPVALTFDGKTNFAKIPVSLTDVSDWSAEITFTTDGDGDNNSEVYLKNCLFGQRGRESVTGGRDFYIAVENGNLYTYCENEKDDDELIDTKIKVADGKQHTVKIVSNPSDNGISVYCDGVYANTVYIKGTNKKTVCMPTPCLGANGRDGRDAGHLHFSLYSFKLTKSGKTVAEYEPTDKEVVVLKNLTDNSGNGNNATLYGNTYAYTVLTEDIDFSLSADTSRAVQTITTVNADTNRAFAAHIEAFDISADMERAVYRTELIKTDTGRTVQTTTTINADTNRAIAAHIEAFDISADTGRAVYRAEIVGADTGRTVQAATTINADAARKTVLPFAISVDTRRQFGTSFSIGVDTGRAVQATTTVNADISRAVENTVTASFDAMRAVQVPFTISADTTREIIVTVKLDTDTLRVVERTETVNGDALRYLVFDMDKLLIPANQPPAQGEFTPFPANPPKAATQGIISMSLELATGTLSDTLKFETFGTDFTPKRAIRGNFLDFPYEFRVEQVTSTGERQKMTSMSYIDRLLYVPLKFHVDGGSGDNLKSIAQALAKHLGYACETHLENIYLATDYDDTTVTYSAVMSGAFGWLSELPWRQVNVYIKDGTMYFVQRGQEPTVYDITNLHHDEPTIVQRVYRSRFSQDNKNTKPARSVHAAGFTGRVDYPDGGYTEYANGQPILSERSTDSASVFTRWEYDMNGKLIAQSSHTTPKKDGVNPSETHTRLYYYQTATSGGYTITETRTTTIETDSKTGKSTTTETVNYSESGKNSTTSTTIRDGDMVVSNGPVGTSTASEYAVNQQNIVMTGGATKWLDDDGNEIEDEADISLASLPLSTKDNSGVKLSELSAEINNHDRCIQETVEINILEPVKDGAPALWHVINFGERIKYNGNEYNLERNTVTRTAREIRQSITITRWC